MARMFGTDGVRGVAGTELTIELAMKLGQAGAYVLTKEQSHQPTIIIGCDTRISGGMLANALMAGICSVGANAIFVGVAPTPAIAYLTRKHKVDAGVVISASHNPMEFNGIKFFNGDGYKLSDQLEDEIEALIRNDMEDVVFPIGPGIGRVEYRFDIVDEYIAFEKKTVPVDLSALKIVVDCAEGASSYTSVKTLKDLGANLIAIHTNPVVPTEILFSQSALYISDQFPKCLVFILTVTDKCNLVPRFDTCPQYTQHTLCICCISTVLKGDFTFIFHCLFA